MAWAAYVWRRELLHHEVSFGQNPRFRDWRPMYHVARPALSRITGRSPEELNGYLLELASLHAELRRTVSDVPSAGALIQAPLLYLLVRALRPERAIETGISSGYSARLILEALEKNGTGHLDSIGIDVFGLARGGPEDGRALVGRSVGWLVPERLKPRWSLHLGRSDEHLPRLLAGYPSGIDLFLHDSLHQYETMRWEYEAAYPSLRVGGLLASHDIHANRAWPEFVETHHLPGDEELDHDLGVVRRPTGTG